MLRIASVHEQFGRDELSAAADAQEWPAPEAGSTAKMVALTRTPLRVSFAGGGSDIEWYYRERMGAVISTTISRYVYVRVSRSVQSGAQARADFASAQHTFKTVENSRVSAALRLLGMTRRVVVESTSDAPAAAGLGSSSAFTVGLLKALHSLLNQRITTERLAAKACRVEIDLCGEPIGKQDQYAAAFGGLNLLEFAPDASVRVQPVACSQRTLRALEAQLLVLFTGTTRSAAQMLEQQRNSILRDRKRRVLLERMVHIAYALKGELERGVVGTLGEMLHEGWLLKKSLACGISNLQIDSWYEIAQRNGAVGGKILGAGGGGCLLLVAPPERHAAIKHALPMLTALDIKLTDGGSHAIRAVPTPT